MKQLCVWCDKVMPLGEAELCSEACAKQYWDWLQAEIRKWPLLPEQQSTPDPEPFI